MSFDKPLAVSVAVLALVAAHALAQKSADSSPPTQQEIVARFDRLDTNHDGILSRSEVSTMPGLSEIFDRSDTNKDGKLDIAEFQTVLRH